MYFKYHIGIFKKMMMFLPNETREETETCTPLYTTYYFLIQIKGDVIPIEVKAEENLRSKSLKAFMSSHSDLKAIRFSMSGYIDQEWLTNVPLYGIPFVFTRLPMP